MVTQEIHSQVWAAAVERIRERSPATFNCWFAGVQLDGSDNGVLRLRARDEFVRDWVRNHFEPTLLDEIHAISGQRFETTWTIDANLDAPVSCAAPAPPVVPRAIHVVRSSPEPEPRPSEPPSQGRAALPPAGVNPKNTFANFVVGPSNQLAFAAAVAASGGGGLRYNPLFLCGSTGLGKTHLLHGIAHRVLHERPSARIVYGSADSFTNEYITALTERRMDHFRARYHGCDVLLIDDIQFIAGKASTQDEFFHTFNALYDLNRQIVVTSDKYPHEIPDLEERLRTRFQWGLIADIQQPELETRVAILRKKADSEKIMLPDDCALFLATHIKSNVRELEGSLIRLAAIASLQNADISVEFAQQTLKTFLSPTGSTLTIETIQKEVASYFSLKVSDIKGTKRHKAVARPRQIAMFLSRKLTRCSFPEIGQRFGGKDHSTVISACRKIEDLVEKDLSIRTSVETIERQLNL